MEGTRSNQLPCLFKVNSLNTTTLLQPSLLKLPPPAVIIGGPNPDAHCVLILSARTLRFTRFDNPDTTEPALCSTNQPGSIGAFVRATTRTGHSVSRYSPKASTDKPLGTPDRVATRKVDVLAVRGLRG